MIYARSSKENEHLEDAAKWIETLSHRLGPQNLAIASVNYTAYSKLEQPVLMMAPLARGTRNARAILNQIRRRCPATYIIMVGHERGTEILRPMLSFLNGDERDAITAGEFSLIFSCAYLL